MRIAIGSDHAGFQLKQTILTLLKELGHDYQDFGCYEAAAVDYPDIAGPLAEAVAAGEFPLGILACGTGAGMAVSANKIPDVRAVVAHDVFTARQMRQHLNAQVLCLGERIVGPGLAQELVQAFLTADFEGGRHERRVDKIRAMERRNTPATA